MYLIFFSKITGPDNRVIHQAVRESNGKYTFSAHSDGVYKYCFSNLMSTLTPKIIMFSVEVGEQHALNNNGADGNSTGLYIVSKKKIELCFWTSQSKTIMIS